jgi:predicted DNA-binding protein (UPF0251 family)
MMASSISLTETVTKAPFDLQPVADVECVPALEGIPGLQEGDEFSGHDPDLWLYRDRTIGMLRRYMRLSIEVGRLPSLLGREFFRTRVTSYTVSTFEDAVIFVHDVERVLEKLDPFEKKLIAKIVLQDYSQDEAARILNCARRTVVRLFPESVDKVTESFLEGGLLTRLPVTTPDPPETCQEAKVDPQCVSDCASSQ